MQQKAFTLHNRGMNRDLSVSKAGESSAYENHNIRITATDHDTLLSVTNERGNKEIYLGEDLNIEGEIIGWNVLNEHLILFTTSADYDYIYRVDYIPGAEQEFVMRYGQEGGYVNNIPIFVGHLGFNTNNPIESVVYFETEDIQKIYWVDGIHVLRFMNFMADSANVESWSGDNTAFDSNKFADFDINVSIEKDYSGNPRPNGVIQYLLTYYNKHGQQSGYVWISDLIYLSPENIGGGQDGTNSCRIKINIEFDENITYEGFRLYSIFRSSLNGEVVACLVGDGQNKDTVTIIDDYSNQETVDATSLLYLGSQEVHANTLAHKDQTLFLGGLTSTGQDYEWIRQAILDANMYDPETGLVNEATISKKWIEFEYSEDIDYVPTDTQYKYESQLEYPSSSVLSFKGGEKYRFAVMFKRQDGTDTSAFWIGDAVNSLYPVIDVNNGKIKRIVARCTLPTSLYQKMEENNLISAQILIAEASYADRAVKAQGIVNPTVFNLWERYNNRLYATPSWISRPRGSAFAWKHFAPIKNSVSSYGEIQCNHWGTEAAPTPYYQIVDWDTANPKYATEFEGEPPYQYILIVYHIYRYMADGSFGAAYGSGAMVVFANCFGSNGENMLKSKVFTAGEVSSMTSDDTYGYVGTITEDDHTAQDPAQNGFTLTMYRSRNFSNSLSGNDSSNRAYNDVISWLVDTVGIKDESLLITKSLWETWREPLGRNRDRYFTKFDIAYDGTLNEWEDGLNRCDPATPQIVSALERFVPIVRSRNSSKWGYNPSYYRKHLMFVDENVITLDSPEIAYGSSSFDKTSGYKFRIVGVAKITGEMGDYVVHASHGKLSGENLFQENFGGTEKSGGLDGLTSWPLWTEYGLELKDTENDIDKSSEERTPEDYNWGGSVVNYWLHMWHKAGKIHAYDADEETEDYSRLYSKVFANLRYSNTTIYDRNAESNFILDYDSLRIFNNPGSQYVNINIDGDSKFYDGCPDFSLSMSGTNKYPIIYSHGTPDPVDGTSSMAAYLYSKDPIRISYLSNPHAVISLPTIPEYEYDGQTFYSQTILPWIYNSEKVISDSHNASLTGWIVPWMEPEVDSDSYPYRDYLAYQNQFSFYPDNDADTLNEQDKYLFIGEIFEDYSEEGKTDNRYGGISENAIERNRFIPASFIVRKEDMHQEQTSTSHGALVTYGYSVIANQGDTYFQRWDCLRTKPVSGEPLNGVIDITSVMLETHINIDGRTDLQRGLSTLASINTEQFGTINPVYSQRNNFYTKRQLDSDFNEEKYRSSVTWTLDKSDSAEIDEWTHITLANTLKLDGDKGSCNAIRRFQNSLIAFQDRAISEILFNSRTQLTTTDGVPVEIANSGKVDGKRYITNKYGCTNKWSIVEGKSALYFVDNINKAFCSFNGGIENLSASKGFSAWFRRYNNVAPWTPDEFDNIVAYYDRIHSDVYLVGNEHINEHRPTLVYNEMLGEFTSFFDYDSVPMMTNVEDRFVSFKDHRLWLQNEGFYCNFFDSQYDYWVNYRVTPDPFGDKIWTNIDYRADFYRVLDENATLLVRESEIIAGDLYDDNEGIYQENTTFDNLQMWNEYQKTEIDFGKDFYKPDPARKKFRIWRLTIPRAMKSDRTSDSNKYGLDRMRNPWISLKFTKKLTEDDDDQKKDLMQLHDITVRYFE